MAYVPVVAVFLVIAAMLGFLVTSNKGPTNNTSDQTNSSVSATPNTTKPETSPTQTQVKGNTNMKQYPQAPAMTIDQNKKYTAVISTNKGDMTAELFVKEAPKTVNNFVFLANDHFYDNVRFHRIIKGFMQQTGDPTGTGMGSPGYRFDDEKPITKDYTKGTLAMANSGPNTNGSQFFIMNADYALPKNYVIFGKVTQGMETVDAIANTPVTASETGEPSKPTEDVIIKTVTVKSS